MRFRPNLPGTDQIAGRVDLGVLAGVEEGGRAHFLNNRGADQSAARREPGAIVYRRVDPAGPRVKINPPPADLRRAVGYSRCGQLRLRNRTDHLMTQGHQLDGAAGDVVAVDFGMSRPKAPGEFGIEGGRIAVEREAGEADLHLEILPLVSGIDAVERMASIFGHPLAIQDLRSGAGKLGESAGNLAPPPRGGGHFAGRGPRQSEV